MEKKFFLPESNLEVVIGKFAQQADGAVWLQQGGTVILSTVVSSKSSEFPGFLPLTVDTVKIFQQLEKFPVAILSVKANLVIKRSLLAV